MEAELSSQENVVEDALKDSSETQKAYSIVEEELEAIEDRFLKEIEDEQIGLSDSLSKVEKTMPMPAKKLTSMPTVCMPLNAIWTSETCQESLKNSWN